MFSAAVVRKPGPGKAWPSPEGIKGFTELPRPTSWGGLGEGIDWADLNRFCHLPLFPLFTCTRFSPAGRGTRLMGQHSLPFQHVVIWVKEKILTLWRSLRTTALMSHCNICNVYKLDVQLKNLFRGLRSSI